MKQSCNVIKDLLILYEDDVCSEDSRNVVEEHLKECEKCSNYFQKLKSTDEVISQEIKEELSKDNKAIKRGFKKIRRRWILSMIAVFMLIPAIGIGILAYHEKHDDGVAFTNWDDIYRTMKYLGYIEDKEFEKAAEMVDFSNHEYTLVDSVKHMTVEEYQEYMKERFIKKLQEYDELGIYIDNISYDSSYRQEGNRWTVCVAFDENYPDGSEQKMIVHLDGKYMYLGAISYPYMGKTGMDDYIDEILHLYSEDDPLDYQEFEVAFELKEGEKAIISLKNNEGIEIDIYELGLFNITYGTGASLIIEPFYKDTFVASVPGKYAICQYTSQEENVFLTAEDIDIQIINYE